MIENASDGSRSYRGTTALAPGTRIRIFGGESAGRALIRVTLMPPIGRAADAGRSWQHQSVTDPARELADLRAWLTTALRLAPRQPGPNGLTILGMPSDRELIGLSGMKAW
jgi:hypothetical protein